MFGDPRTEFMTGIAGIGTRRQEDEFPVWVHFRSVGDVSQCSAMFGMTGDACRLLCHHLAVPGHDGGGRPTLKRSVGMTGHTARGTGATEWLVAVGAAGNIDMISAQISWRPEGGRTSDCSPPDPNDQHQGGQSHHRHRGSWQGVIAHRYDKTPAKNSAPTTCRAVSATNIRVMGAWIACQMRNASSCDAMLCSLLSISCSESPSCWNRRR